MEQTQKRKAGRPPNKPRLSGPELAEACLFKGYRQIMKDTGVGQTAAMAMAKISKLTVEQFVEEQRPKLQRLMSDLLTQAQDELAKLSPMQKYVAYGILRDKHDTEPKTINQAVHIHLKNGDGAGVLKQIFGPAGETICKRAGIESNNASRSVDTIEVTATPSQYTGPTALDASARDVESSAKKQ